MLACADPAPLLAFAQADPIRYRHILHALAPPCPAWDRAMRAWYGGAESVSVSYYVDHPDQPALIAVLEGAALQVEGDPRGVPGSSFADWCRALPPASVLTTSSGVRDLVGEALGIREWQVGADYTVTQRAFTPRLAHRVWRLGAEDRPAWARFVQRHAHEPMVAPGKGGSGAAVRDVAFLDAELPIEVYVTGGDGEISGLVTTNPLTDECDEVSMLFVDPAHRGQGLAHSLLSAATAGILGRGRQPAYAAAGDAEARPDLFRLLTGLGYRPIGRTWRWWG